MKYHFKIHKEGKGFWAQCIELQGCFTQADSINELQKNMEEALNLCIQEPQDSKDLAALPDESIKKSKTILEVPLNPEIAFAFMVRYYRIKHGLTQQQAAKRMGFDKIYSYQRLEARKCNPTLKILSKIKKLFPDFSIDYALGC
jgi:predicted RNase H-like HicB family nuclease/DNA-binding XRE family transcriptional regulator